MLPKCYFQVEVRGSSELAPPVILAAVVEALHRSGQAGRYALGFPESEGRSLGSSLRVFSDDESVLTALQDKLACEGVDDEIKTRRIEPVPSNCDWELFEALKPNLSSDVRRRRRRHDVGTSRHAPFSDGEIQSAAAKWDQIHTSLPFLRLWSLSTRQKMTIYLRTQTADSAMVRTNPNSYGFSTGQQGLFRCPVPKF